MYDCKCVSIIVRKKWSVYPNSNQILQLNVIRVIRPDQHT